MIYPENTGCVTPSNNVSIRLRNDGYEVIPAGIGLTCIVNGDTLTGITAGPNLTDRTIDYTFSSPISIKFVQRGDKVELLGPLSRTQRRTTGFNFTLVKSKEVQYQP